MGYQKQSRLFQTFTDYFYRFTVCSEAMGLSFRPVLEICSLTSSFITSVRQS